MRLTAVVAFCILMGLSACQTTRPNSSATGQSSIQYSGGDGTSAEKAVVISGARSSMDGVPAEYTRADTPLDPTRIVGPDSPEWDTPPRLKKGKAPVYPISLHLSEKEGKSVIVYTVGKDGRATNFEVQSTTDDRFANHAIIAIKAWVFEPATKGGVPVEARLRQVFGFGIR